MRSRIVLEQHYRDQYSILFIAGFLLLTILKVSQELISGFHFSIEVIALIVIAILLSFLIYYLMNATLKVKFGKKKISIRVLPLGFTKIKFKKANIQSINFIKTSEVSKSSGGFVHFGNKERVFNFGGNKAMIISMKDGRNYSFFSNELFQQKEEILQNVFH